MTLSENSNSDKHKSNSSTKKKSYKEQIAILRTQADQGDAEAQYAMAKYYKDVSNEWQFHYLQRAANHGHSEAQYELGCLYDVGHLLEGACKLSYGLAAHYFKLAADQGVGIAQVNIGYYYEYGLGVFQSYEKAFYYYSIAADKGLYHAQALLGNCYEYGHGVEKSMEKAKHYYALSLKGITEEDPVIELDLGKYFLECAQKTKNNKKNQVSADLDYAYYMERSFRNYFFAFLHYKAKALVNGDIDAFYKVIECYKTGTGVIQGDGKVLQYLQLLAGVIIDIAKLGSLRPNPDQNALKLLELQEKVDNHSAESAKAMHLLAWFSKDGTGANAYNLLFQYYLECSAFLNYAPALYDLGECYDYGTILPCDPKMAAECYLKAAELGFPQAQFAIGSFFEHGIAVEKSDEKAYTFYKKAADQGNIFALGKMGRFEESRSSTEVGARYYNLCAQCDFDETKASEKVLRAIAMPDNKSTQRLRRCYEENFVCYRARAAFGDSAAQCRVGDYYRQGLSVEAFLGLAEYFYSLSAEQGNPKALRWLGYILEREGKFQEAFAYYKKSADLGDPCSLGLLAQCYEEGKGVFQCIEEANYYYELCAKANWDEDELYENSFKWGHIQLFIFNLARAALGNTEAQNIVAGCYERGDGTFISKELGAFYRLLASSPEESKRVVYQKYQQDLENRNLGLINETMEVLETKAKNEDRDARYHLALCYLKGDGVAPSKEKYKNYLLLAAAQGHNDAFDDFANKYDYGLDGFSLSYEESAKIIMSAAEQGNLSAKTVLGYLFEFGLGVKQSDKQAISWYEKASKEEDYLAMWYLANCYELGHCVAQSIELSTEYYARGYSKILETDAYSDLQANQDVAKGRKYLQMASNDNSGYRAAYFVERSFRHFQKAYLYYRAKAGTGDIDAIRHIAECYHLGLGVEKSEELFRYYSEIASEP